MSLNETPSTWIGKTIKFIEFARYGIDESEYNALLSNASLRAKEYILDTQNGLGIPQSALDNATSYSDLQIGYQLLSYSFLLDHSIGLFSNTLPFSSYSSPERESISQNNEALNRWLNIKNRLYSDALDKLKPYSAITQTQTPLPTVYNWS